MKPAEGLPLIAACWLTNAIKPAQLGDEQLVPPIFPLVGTELVPLCQTIQTELAGIATSGLLRQLGEPPQAVILIPVCQLGMAQALEAIEPLVPDQPVSDDQAPPGSVVVKSVPPT